MFTQSISGTDTGKISSCINPVGINGQETKESVSHSSFMYVYLIQFYYLFFDPQAFFRFINCIPVGNALLNHWWALMFSPHKGIIGQPYFPVHELIKITLSLPLK